MNLASLATSAAERLDLPDPLLRAGIAAMVRRSARELARHGGGDAEFVAAMNSQPVAVHTAAANAQHYELPEAFFGHVLGPRRKYSCCLYRDANATLARAEKVALDASADMAELADGQSVLDLGCGWGSFSLYLAARYPRSRITAVSNSAGQRAYIEQQVAARRLGNLTVHTADMNEFAPSQTFDRIVSIEMFEHMANWREVLTRVRTWLAPGGSLFLHVFTHRTIPYRFDHEHGADWIGQHFFTGGVMPSHTLLSHFSDLFTIAAECRWSGVHYQRTALHWLANFDRSAAVLAPVLRDTYGDEAVLWTRRWRLFFLAVAGLFGHAGGDVWGVSQYRLNTTRR